jgi:hypothetical protein
MSDNADKKTTRGLTGRPFAGLALPGDPTRQAVDVPRFRHFHSKSKAAVRGVDNAAAREAADKIALSARATTTLTMSDHGPAVRVQEHDVVVVLVRDRYFAGEIFVPSFFVVGLPDDGDHLSRIISVAAEVDLLVSVEDRLSLLGGSS